MKPKPILKKILPSNKSKSTNNTNATVKKANMTMKPMPIQNKVVPLNKSNSSNSTNSTVKKANKIVKKNL